MKNRTSFQMYSVLILMLGLTLSACQKAGQSKSSPGNPAAPASPGAPNASGTPEMDGTGDVGGGNGLNGRVLESYRVDVTKLEAFKKILKPKFDAMDELDRKAKKRTIEESSTKNMNFKTWYVAPLKLKIINNDVLGLSFSQDRTEQLAAQTRREIWVNKEAFDKMDIEHQAELIMHELFMAYYMMKFESGEDICKTLIADTENFTCENLNGPLAQAPEPARNLNEDDYSRIRTATVWFLSQGSTLTGDQMTSKMQRLGFDKRFGGSEDGGPLFIEANDRSLSMKEVFSRVQQGLQRGLFKSDCLTNIDGLQKSFPCVFEMDFSTPAKNDKGEVVKDAFIWNLKSEKPLTGNLMIQSYSSRGGIYGNTYRVGFHHLSADYMMQAAGLIKEGSRYFEVHAIIKRTTPASKTLKLEVIGILFVERIFFGQINYEFQGSKPTCFAYGSTLNSEGHKNYILLKAKTGYDEKIMMNFDDWIQDPDCDQQFPGGTRI